MLPNSHEVILRNKPALTAPVACIGLLAPALLAELPGRGLAHADHAGVYGSLAAYADWQVRFGLQSEVKPGQMATVVVFMPKARRELVMRLAYARHLVRAGGQIWLVGEKREGIAGGATEFKAQFNEAVKLDSARHCQLWSARVAEGGAPFTVTDWLSWHDIEVAGHQVAVAGLPGIFSDGHLDDGTRLLLESIDQASVAGPVLDFACGAGVIGAWLSARFGASLVVNGVDVQAQAVACARESYRRAGVSGEIVASDGLGGAMGRYQTLVTNPPFHQGVKTDLDVTESFLRGAAAHLLPGGELWLVANRFLPYRPLMEQHIGRCEIVAEDSRFFVYRAWRR
ncbi:MAG: class I SAM-dependent methyltransferase [Marinobacter sp.]|nr:class I SAM-dependent methyltransferase [Marinobacter sp.]